MLQHKINDHTDTWNNTKTDARPQRETRWHTKQNINYTKWLSGCRTTRKRCNKDQKVYLMDVKWHAKGCRVNPRNTKMQIVHKTGTQGCRMSLRTIGNTTNRDRKWHAKQFKINDYRLFKRPERFSTLKSPQRVPTSKITKNRWCKKMQKVHKSQLNMNNYMNLLKRCK